MRYKELILILSFLLCLIGERLYADFKWNTASPEGQGMSSVKLDVMKDTLAARRTKAFLVIRNDKIVYEWYSPTHGPKKRHYSASLAKAINTSLMHQWFDSHRHFSLSFSDKIY